VRGEVQDEVGAQVEDGEQDEVRAQVEDGAHDKSGACGWSAR